MPEPALTRRSILAGAAGTALATALPTWARPAPRRPNVLFILADDLGYADLSCYGRRDYQTPAIDSMAADGMLFAQGYANSPVCSPTRVALMTGRYHQRLPVGLPEPIEGTEVGLGLPANHPTLPGILRAAGYRTSLVGKWHMGWPPEFGPLNSGYDSFFGIAPGAADHFTHTYGQVREKVLFEGDNRVHRDGYLTELLAERATAEIREHARQERPFFMSLHFTAPHWPWQGPADRASSAAIKRLRHEDGGSLEIYAQMMGALDNAVKKVLGAVDDAGLTDDTIVVFTSDNGGERFSDHWPLRGEKGQLLEGGIRVPLIVRWPASINANSRSDQVMTSMDWLPTLAAATGASMDPSSPADGANLLDVLTGAAPSRPRVLFWRHRQSAQAAVRDGDLKYLRMGDEEFLYDLRNDPRERANLKDRDAATAKRLKTTHAAWNATMLPYPPTPPAS